MANKPTSLSFFIKRMLDSGYAIQELFSNYSDSDPRVWTVMIDPGHSSVICTCYVNRASIGDNYFEFYDGGQFLPNYKIKTQSMEVLLDELNSHGIINKRRKYMTTNITTSVATETTETIIPSIE
jgi:hypothetical protein